MAETTAGTGKPIINIRGQRVGLGPLDLSMIPDLTRWINDFETMRTLGMDPRPMTPGEEEHWFTRVTTSSDTVIFAVFDMDDVAFVGTVNLFKIDHRHRTCELGIAILDPARRGKGLGTEAVQLITDYAIHAMGLHNVHLATYEYNHAGQRAYAKAGFKEYGRRREARFHNGEWWDIIYMDVIASEWESPVMRKMMTPDEPR
ncbi:MAG TPA: GNAT family protein [Thermomicrobiales bacterium]|nr:GNAT family protein [Thermomicrobiales bacterium]